MNSKSKQDPSRKGSEKDKSISIIIEEEVEKAFEDDEEMDDDEEG